jgi:hypothetical protein
MFWPEAEAQCLASAAFGCLELRARTTSGKDFETLLPSLAMGSRSILASCSGRISGAKPACQ